MSGLIAKVFVDEKYLNSARMQRTARNDRMTADTVGRETVRAASGCRTGGLPVQTLDIWRRSDIACTSDGIFEGDGNFIAADDQAYMRRTLYKTGDTVSVAIDIDQLSVHGDGVGTHKIIVSHNGAGVQFPRFFGRFRLFPVDQGVIPGSQQIHYTAFFNRHTAAP